jgi:hypothetical protein
MSASRANAPRPHGSEAATGGTRDVGQVDDLAPCPSCSAMLSTGESDGMIALLHPMPFCDYFGRTAPEVVLDDLMKAATAAPRVKA